MTKKIFILFLFIMFKVGAQVSDFKHINFKKAENIAKLHKGQSLKNLPLLTYKLTNNLSTDVEKFRSIYYWVCHNIKNDFNSFKTISRKRKKYQNNPNEFLKWNNEYKKNVFKNLLSKKKTVCTGYAYLIEQMAYIAGIECKIIDGYGRNTTNNIDTIGLPNHTWNAVKLNNKWYLCDATWSSGYLDENLNFIQHFNNGYFLTNPKLFAKNHQPIHKEWSLNVNQSNETFVSKPIVYDATFEHQITPISPKKLYLKYTRNENIKFEFNQTRNIEAKHISLVYFDKDDNQVSLGIKGLSNTDGIIRFMTKIKNKGSYDIHLKYKNDYVASYMIQIN